MKRLFLLAFAGLFIGCQQPSTNTKPTLRDGFYQVNNKGTDSTNFGNLHEHEIVVTYNSIYNRQEFTKLLIDTSDFVPLELELLPVIQKDSSQMNRLSISLSADAAGKMKAFTATRIMKGLAIVLNGEAITMHKVRDTIQGGNMVISWCGENACRQLYTKIKGHVK